jgi:hypothetical protein
MHPASHKIELVLARNAVSSATVALLFVMVSAQDSCEENKCQPLRSHVDILT